MIVRKSFQAHSYLHLNIGTLCFRLSSACQCGDNTDRICSSIHDGIHEYDRGSVQKVGA